MRLVLRDGPGSGSDPGVGFELADGENLIGRSSGDDDPPGIDLEAYDSDAKVSRRHAVLIVSGETVVIEDVGSLNGTYVMTERVNVGERVPVPKGSDIVVGTIRLRLVE